MLQKNLIESLHRLKERAGGKQLVFVVPNRLAADSLSHLLHAAEITEASCQTIDRLVFEAFKAQGHPDFKPINLNKYSLALYPLLKGPDTNYNSYAGMVEKIIADFSEIDYALANSDDVLAEIRAPQLYPGQYGSADEISLGQEFENISNNFALLSGAHRTLLEKLDKENSYPGASVYRKVAENPHTFLLPLVSSGCYYVFAFHVSLSRAEESIIRFLISNSVASIWLVASELMRNDLANPGNDNYNLIKKDIAPDKIEESTLAIASTVQVTGTGSIISQGRAICKDIKSKDAGKQLRIGIAVSSGYQMHALSSALAPLRENFSFCSFITPYLKWQPLTRLLVDIINMCADAFGSDGRQIIPRDTFMAVWSHPAVQRLSEECGTIQIPLYFVNVSQVSAQCKSEDLKTLFSLPTTADELTDYLTQIINILAPKYNDSLIVPDGEPESYLDIINSLKDTLEYAQRDGAGVTFHFACAFYSTSLWEWRINFIDKESVEDSKPKSTITIFNISNSSGALFDIIYLVAANEKLLGPEVNNRSFVPPFIQERFGIRGEKDRVSKHAWMMYNAIAGGDEFIAYYDVFNGLGKATDRLKSRYLQQLELLHGFKEGERDKLNKAAPVSIPKSEPKTEEYFNALDKLNPQEAAQFDGGFSASSLNEYRECPYKFYLNKIKRVDQSNSDDQEDLDARTTGTVLHKVLEEIFRENSEIISKKFSNLRTKKERVEHFKERSNVEDLNKLIEECFLSIKKLEKRDDESRKQITEQNILDFTFIQIFVHLVLENTEPDTLGFPSETEVKKHIIITSESGRKYHLTGNFDRVDKLESTTKIVDYKTGSVKSSDPNHIYKSKPQDSKVPFQLMMYQLLYEWNQEANSIHDSNSLTSAKAYVFGKTGDKGYQYEQLKNSTIEDLNSFKEYLIKLLDEIYDPTKDIERKGVDNGACRYCSYKSICLT